MCLLTETRALSAQGEKRALVGNLTMPVTEVIGSDDAAAEATVGEVLAEGSEALAAANFCEFDRAAFIRAWTSAPPSLLSTAIHVPVGNNEGSKPTVISDALVSLARRELAQRLKAAGVQPARYDVSAATRLESDRIAPILRAMLSEAISRFDCESLFAVALRELERSLSAKWFQEQERRHNEGFPVLAYDPVERELSEGHESQKLTQVVTLLAEESLATANSGGRDSITRLEWMRLLAVAELLMESYIRSESNHYGLVSAVTVIDSMFGVEQETVTDSSPFDQRAFAEARARFKIASAATPSLTAGISDQHKAIVTRISDALFDTVGFHLETLATVLKIGQTWAVDPGEEIAEITIDEFRARCTDIAPDQDVNEAVMAVGLPNLAIRANGWPNRALGTGA